MGLQLLQGYKAPHQARAILHCSYVSQGGHTGAIQDVLSGPDPKPSEVNGKRPTGTAWAVGSSPLAPQGLNATALKQTQLQERRRRNLTKVSSMATQRGAGASAPCAFPLTLQARPRNTLNWQQKTVASGLVVKALGWDSRGAAFHSPHPPLCMVS